MKVPRLFLLPLLFLGFLAPLHAEFQAGAAIVDVTPQQFPVLVNGSMRSRETSEVTTPVHARAIVLEDADTRMAIVVVDSCMMNRDLLDKAKALAAEQTQIRPDRMLISATHTHTAPASMGCLGTSADLRYTPLLIEKIAEAIVAAEANLEPAEAGWASADAAEYTAVRRWVRRPDRVDDDPFGNPTVRANMHAGRVWDNVTGESGPEDPELSLISFRATDGRPIALLANFSMHYFGGEKPVSADYFGLFAGEVEGVLGHDEPDTPPFVGIMSHGCSGDIYRVDYTKTAEERGKGPSIHEYAAGLAEIALSAHASAEFQSNPVVKMEEARLPLNYRVPDKQRLEWSQRIVETMGDALPKHGDEIYAREQVFLHEWQKTAVVLQGIRIGDIGIATTPNETYALTGLKLKARSPLRHTMVFDLANGGDGYIPPPEQHHLGGYNTWAARSAGLEVLAEPKIAETCLQLLESVAGEPRIPYQQSRGPSAEAIAQSKPVAWWRMDEMEGPRAIDHSGNARDGIYEDGVVYFLEGPKSEEFCLDGETNRSAFFTGDRMQARIPKLGETYSISLWFWNGMPQDAREITGWMFSRGRDFIADPHGDHLGLGGLDHAGKLVFQHGKDPAARSHGSTVLERWTWNHALLVRDGESVRVYLNGSQEPEIDTAAPADFPDAYDDVFIGGHSSRQDNWEGRLDEVAVYDRVVAP